MTHPAVLVLYALLLLGVAVLALPFVNAGELDWHEQSVTFLLGTAILVGTIVIHATCTGAVPFAARLAGIVLPVTWGAEALGLATGAPFGAAWTYHVGLLPRLPGEVPLVIPLAWLVLCYAPPVLLRGIRVRDGGRLRTGALVVKSLAAALFLVGLDLVLDPLAVSTGAWTWHAGGPYFEVPISNFAGWLAVGSVVFLAVFVLEGVPAPRSERVARRADGLLLLGGIAFVVLAWIAVLTRLGSGLPIGLCLLATLPAWVMGARDIGRGA